MTILYTYLTAIVLSLAVPPSSSPSLSVPVTLENNSAEAQAIMLIWYSPLCFGNSTEQLTVAPGAQITRRYAVGTKLYLASEAETSIVMGGGRIDDLEPFLKVSLKSRKAVYPLF
jgi:hypothetical protein